MNSFSFDIDVVSRCNLRCPSCPQGDNGTVRPAASHMEPEMLAEIVAKAQAECQVTGISLFSWGEPFLHPRIAELVAVVTNNRLPCHLSSNLNVTPDFDALLAANPTSIKVSVSGFTQDVYCQTHRGGDIECVKQNLQLLVEAKRRQRSTTRIFINYHRYRHNLREELMMREFATRLGIEFEPAWALLLPVERVLNVLERGEESALSDDECRLLEMLVVPPSVDGMVKESCMLPCRLRDEQISISADGKVQLCCGVFSDVDYSIGTYLDLPLTLVQQVRHGHPLCCRCMKIGVHAYITYQSLLMIRQIRTRVLPEEIRLLGLRGEFFRDGMLKYAAQMYRRIGKSINLAWKNSR